MATRKTSVIGQISGKLGDTVTRYRNGKYIVYSKPDNYNISYSRNAVSGRAKFANTVKLAKLLNDNPAISLVWKLAKIKGANAYQKIIKYNSKYISPEGITLSNIITPPGSSAFAKEIILNEANITIKCILEKEFINTSPAIYVLISFTKKKCNDLFFVSSDNSKTLGEEYFQAVVSLSEEEKKKLYSSERAVVLAAFISTIPKIKWTNTLSFEVNPLHTNN